MMGYPPMKSSLTELARPQEDDLDFAALLHDNGFTWDDANAVNAILTHHDLVVLRATPVADTAGIDADEEWGSDLDVVEWAVWFGRKRRGKARVVAQQALDQHPGLRFSERFAAALRTPKPEGDR